MLPDGLTAQPGPAQHTAPTHTRVLDLPDTALECIPALRAGGVSSPVLAVPGAPRGSPGDDLAAGSHRTGPDAALSETDTNVC